MRIEKDSVAKGLASTVAAIMMGAIIVSGGTPGSGGPTDVTDTAALAPTGIERSERIVASSFHGNMIAKPAHASFGCKPQVEESSVVFLRGQDQGN